MAKKNKPGPGPCVHCLAHFDKRTWDHVFPVSWYPDSTPANLERWKFPACHPCNASYGRMEQDLLLRVGLCLDPATVEASGIPASVLRSMDPSQARDENDARAREALRRRILGETFIPRPEHMGAVLPGFGPHPGAEPDVAIGLPAEYVDRLAAKVARGLTYVHTGRLIGSDYRFNVFVDPRQGALFEELLDKFGRQYERGPGISVEHAIAHSDPASSIFAFKLWGTLQLWGAVRPADPTDAPAAAVEDKSSGRSA